VWPKRRDQCMNWTAVSYALASACLFGVSTPIAKILLGSMHPGILAGILYCGAGVGVAILRRFRRRGPLVAQEAALTRADLPWLVGAIACGGVLGPILLLVGLSQTNASAASLLLTLEGVATALMAWLFFGENVGRRIALGMLCLAVGAMVLSWSGSPETKNLLGPLAVLGACIAWGLDNNLTRKVSLADPLQIVTLKGLVAGPVNLALGLAAGGNLPPPLLIFSAAILGFLSYGMSLTLFVGALRHLGSARTTAYFSTAPFIGALDAILLFEEVVTWQLVVAGVLMAGGVWLHLTERHEHEHIHDASTHSHAHLHDENHQHQHSPADPSNEPHTHGHSHPRIKHSHQHVPDMHHQHRH
jgi:drug/metabolite transporter (DMT)-like permease